MRPCSHFAAAVVLSCGLAATSAAQQPGKTVTPDRPPTLADLAVQSNLWLPYSERIEPTPGLWGDAECCLRSRSWQEHYMSCRDTLSWLFARPASNAGCQTYSPLSSLLPRWLGGSD